MAPRCRQAQSTLSAPAQPAGFAFCHQSLEFHPAPASPRFQRQDPALFANEALDAFVGAGEAVSIHLIVKAWHPAGVLHRTKPTGLGRRAEVIGSEVVEWGLRVSCSRFFAVPLAAPLQAEVVRRKEWFEYEC